ncbi:recQ-mediated genome instability protein 1 isoform X1 [Nematostella vectensis]|uniref:recQ-mediated genome instability protein 1 isoform X1 n=3 Tax=Nematostella vectensis TaxID=45351 RepID=UPI0020770640|nr:recQ-mediated genome instability protein 1 isoform X1 [Nematostella vectensis]
MAANSARNTLLWLRENYHANVRQGWLDECIDFIKRTNSAADLQEIGEASLPQVKDEVMMVEGTYCLQGRSITQHQLNQLVYDKFLLADLQEIGEASLPQIKDEVMMVEGTYCLQINSVINVGQSAYSQIMKIKGKDDPESHLDKKHTNVIIQGPIACRLGVLLLTRQCLVCILGGSTESLVETNSTWNLLHSSIGQEPPEPPAVVQILEDEAESSSSKPLNKNTQNVSMQSSTRNPFCKSTAKSCQNFFENKHQMSTPGVDSSICANLRVTGKVPGNERANNNWPNTRTSIGKSKLQKTHCKSLQRCDSWGERTDYFDDDDNELLDEDLFLDDIEENLDFDQLDQLEKGALPIRNSASENIASLHLQELQDVFENIDDQDLDDFELDNTNNGSIILCGKTIKRKEDNSRVCSLGVDTGITDYSSKGKFPMKQRNNKEDEISEQVCKKQRQAYVPPFGNSINPKSEKHPTFGKDRQGVLEGMEVIDVDHPVMKPNDQITKLDKMESMGRSYSLESLPFTYLKTVEQHLPFQEDITIRIKAYVSTLVNHSQTPGTGWCVTVKVNDGTAAMDMDLGAEVLTELLQMPVESFQNLMQKARKSPDTELRRSLQQHTEQFQRNLSMVTCLMDVSFVCTRPRPVLIRLRQPSRDDVKMLMSRIRTT